MLKQLNQLRGRLWHGLGKKEPSIRWGPRPPGGRGNFWDEAGMSTCTGALRRTGNKEYLASDSYSLGGSSDVACYC